jgi:hypothetical protein
VQSRRSPVGVFPLTPSLRGTSTQPLGLSDEAIQLMQRNSKARPTIATRRLDV